MINYSTRGDLDRITNMFLSMPQEDKMFLSYDNEQSSVKLVELQYDVIKGKCIILINEEEQKIGFVSISLEHNDYLFITNMYVAPEFRQGSFPILLEMFAHLKIYARPIQFVVHIKNERMQKLADFIKAVAVNTKDMHIYYSIQN